MKRFAAVALLLAGCATAPRVAGPGTSTAPAQAWVAPAAAVPPAASALHAPVALPADVAPGGPLTLAQAVDIALSNNTATRTAWLEARAAEAALGSRRSAYLPEVDLTADLVRGTGQRGVSTSYGPAVALNYLLFDFGGRAAQVEQARQALIAADYLHNDAIQNVVFETQQAWYGYLDAKALLAAQDSTLKERQAALDSAEARHNAGVATISDVLQARTALSQAQLNREAIEGNLRTWEGTLATIMGLPATASFTLGELPPDVPAQQVTESIEGLITRAVADRPDLAAVRAQAQRAAARAREVRAQGLPTVSLSTSAGRTFFGAGNGATNPYSAGVFLRWPVFTGFRNQYDVRQAEILAEASREDVRSLEQQVNLQVWTSYYALQTAAQRLGTSRDLLTSAQQSADVAASRYRAGLGGILDLLTAEAALESARAQEIQARADWFVALAQLARNTGTLGRVQ